MKPRDIVPDGWWYAAKRDLHPRKLEIYRALAEAGRASARGLALSLEGSPRATVVAYHLRAMREIDLVETVDCDADPADPDTTYKLSYWCLLLRPTGSTRERPGGDDGHD